LLFVSSVDFCLSFFAPFYVLCFFGHSFPNMAWIGFDTPFPFLFFPSLLFFRFYLVPSTECHGLFCRLLLLSFFGKEEHEGAAGSDTRIVVRTNLLLHGQLVWVWGLACGCEMELDCLPT